MSLNSFQFGSPRVVSSGCTVQNSNLQRIGVQRKSRGTFPRKPGLETEIDFSYESPKWCSKNPLGERFKCDETFVGEFCNFLLKRVSIACLFPFQKHLKVGDLKSSLHVSQILKGRSAPFLVKGRLPKIFFECGR